MLSVPRALKAFESNRRRCTRLGVHARIRTPAGRPHSLPYTHRTPSGFLRVALLSSLETERPRDSREPPPPKPRVKGARGAAAARGRRERGARGRGPGRSPLPASIPADSPRARRPPPRPGPPLAGRGGGGGEGGAVGLPADRRRVQPPGGCGSWSAAGSSGRSSASGARPRRCPGTTSRRAPLRPVGPASGP